MSLIRTGTAAWMVRIDEIDTAEKGWPYRALTIAPGLRSGMRNQKIMHGRSKFPPPPYAARAKVGRTVNDDDFKSGLTT